MATKSDKIFQSPFEEISDFRFDSGVVEVFEDMIERSVPGYSAILGMTGELSEQFAQPNTCIYDLGCSLGGSSLSIAQRNLPDGVSVIALDTSEPMIKGLQTKLDQISTLQVPVQVRREDICTTEFQTSSFVVLNFTLQFIPPNLRSDLISNIYRSLLPGGALLLSEKIRFEDKKTDGLIIDLHHKFKKSMGYSDLEIAQKRTAIENILVPETISTHHQRLENAGFTQVTTWFQCFNFCSFLAVKPN
jgi:tRNA (cmo5U34)-methyltransferase